MKYLLSLVQINHYPHRIKKSVEWGLKFLFTGVCLFFILSKIDQAFWQQLVSLPSRSHWEVLMAVVVVLMPVNWGLEALKWQLSVPEEKLSFVRAFEVVLAGLAMNWVVPFTAGDAASRLLNTQNRKRAAIAMLVNRAISLGITGTFGGMSVLFYFGYFNLDYGWILGLILMLGIVWFSIRKLSKAISQIFWISLLRYAVFTFQFYLILAIFLPGLPSSVVILGIGWVFLFRSFIPSLFGNFGVREASALIFFEPFLPNPELVLVPCVWIWVINTVIPSMAGVFTIFKLKVNIAS